MASVRKRKRAKGYVWVVAYRGSDRKQHLRTFRTKDEAERFKAEIVADGTQRADASGIDHNITIAKYGVLWLDGVAGSLRGRTLTSYRNTLRLHIEPTLGATRVRDLTQGQVLRLLEAKINAGLSKNSVRLIHAAIRRLLTRARIDGVVRVNCALGLLREMRIGTTRKKTAEDVKAMSREQMSAFLGEAEAHEPAIYPLFVTLYKAGLRLGEGLGLQFGDLDFVVRSLRVERTLHAAVKKGVGAERRTGPPKGGKARTVQMTSALHDVLARHLARRRAQNLKCGLSEAASPWLFATESGGPLDDSRVRKVFARTVKLAKLPHFTPHSARHSFATHHLDMGTSLKWVSEQLGHASIEVTANWYSWALPTGDRSIADRLDSPLATAASNVLPTSDKQRGDAPGGEPCHSAA